MVFTDETRVRLNSDGIVRVFREKGSRFHSKNIQGQNTDKRSLMFWGAIRSDGRKMLIRCPATLNSSGYVEILEKYDRNLHLPDIVPQHDNAPIHRSREVSNYLSEKKWDVLEWPPYSPDLNPMENIWAILKKSLQGQTLTWENLEETVIDIWNNISPEIIRNMYASYESRLVKTIKNDGNMIGY